MVVAPGRRWSVLYFLPPHEVIDPNTHRLSGIGSTTFTLDPHLEYRWIFDTDRQLWRLDVRVHASGG